MVPSHGFSPRSYFFDNPRRYDSDDDLAWNIAPQGTQGRWDTRGNCLLPVTETGGEKTLTHCRKVMYNKLSGSKCCKSSRRWGEANGEAKVERQHLVTVGIWGPHRDCKDPRMKMHYLRIVTVCCSLKKSGQIFGLHVSPSVSSKSGLRSAIY